MHALSYRNLSGHGLRAGEAAVAVGVQVRVGRLGGDLPVVLHHPFVGAEVEAAVAGVVALGPGAVHEVLLRQGREGARLQEELPLGRARGAIAPAAAAGALLLKWIHACISKLISTKEGVN